MPGLFHAVFLRTGGVSPPPYSALNVGDKVGDNPLWVAANRESIRKRCGVSQLVAAENVHGAKVSCLTRKLPFALERCDGLLSQEADLALLITHADCQALLLFDPVTRTIGNVHAGWRGNVAGIFTVAIKQMCEKYGAQASNILACISPSLGPCHSEFVNYKEEFPERLWKFQVKPYYFDLWEMSRSELLKAGILPHHIEIARLCTYDHPEQFFSYRRDKVTGRNGTVIALN